MKQLIFIVILTLGWPATAQNFRTVVLPDFKELRELNPKLRQEFIKAFIKASNDTSLDFLDGVYLAERRDHKKVCFAGLYGAKAVIQNSDRRSRRYCKSDMKAAEDFFKSLKNADAWAEFNVRLALACLKQESCAALNPSVQTIKKSMIAQMEK